MTDANDTIASPWGAITETSTRKVAWGSAAPAPEDAAPAPRVDAPGGPAASAPEHLGAVLPSSGDGDLAGLFGTVASAPADLPLAAATRSSDTFADLFASNPAGRNQAAAAADTDPFGQLFADSSAAAVVSPPAADALDALFADSRPADPVAQDHPAADPDLADAPPGPITAAGAVGTPADGPAAETAPEMPAADLTGVFGNPMVEAPADAPVAAPTPAHPFAGEVSNPFSSAGPVPDPAQASSRRQSRVASQRAAIDAARVAAPGPVEPSQESLALIQADRYTRAEEFAPLVSRLLDLGSSDGDPQMRALLRNLQLTRDHTLDAQQRSAYQAMLEPKMASSGLQVHTREDLATLFDIAYDEMIGIGPLGPLWRDDSITEIMVSGPYKVTIERRGQLELTPVRFRDLEHLEETARRLGQSSKDDRAISATNPLVTIQLPGARVQFVWRPLAVSRVAITIRKFGALMGMRELLGFGSLTEEMAVFLSEAVRARATVLVSGGTGSGKTTFINALSEFIPDSERVITIEDALELQLRNTHVEAFLTKEAASADDQVLFGQDLLLKASLRMRPDRIIVGEIRDAKGCSVMLEAANTGHAGTMTTIHANSPAKAINRMAGLLRRVDAMPDDVAREEVGGAIDLVVQVVRTRGRRYVSAISVVDDLGNTTDMFTGEYRPDSSAPTFSHVGTFGADTALALKMLDAGLDPSAWER